MDTLLMIIGYARVSTQDQNPDLQIDALKKFGCEKIFIEKISGGSKIRPELEKAKDILLSDDIFVVWKLDRIGRSLKDLIAWISYFEEHDIAFKSLHDPIDISTPAGKLIFHIFGALAEFERNLIRERTMAGLEAARSRGRKGGRKPKLDKNQIIRLKKLYLSKTMSTKELCRQFDISKPTLYKYI